MSTEFEATTEDWKDLLRRAIEARRQKPTRQGKRVALWSAVGSLLGIGSGHATRICEALGFDPNEMVRG